MAIEKGHTIGEVTGTLGGVVRRKRYGKIIVSSRPARYRKSKSKEAVEGRDSFALSVAFAKAVNGIPRLKQVWQFAKLDGVVAYNRVIKYNKQFIKDNAFTLNNLITPSGVYLLISEIKLAANKLSVKIELKESDLINLLKDHFHFHLVIFAFDPLDQAGKPFIVLSQSREITKSAENGFISLDIFFDTATEKYLKQFRSAVTYIAATNFRGNKKEIFWTNTVAKQFNL